MCLKEKIETECLSALLDLVFRFYPEVWISVTESLSHSLRQMRTFLRPLHLRLFGKPLIYDLEFLWKFLE
jgi:hypothetical protein